MTAVTNRVSHRLHRFSAVRRAVRLVAGLAAVLVALAGWALLAPPALGGGFSYVTTSGNSMEPTLHAGDLAIVRSASSYQVGDVVAYRSERVGRIVLHRIIGGENGRYELRGDNNTWVDADRPNDGQIMGELVAHAPGVGSALRTAASPTGLSLASAVVGGLIIATARRDGATSPRAGRRTSTLVVSSLTAWRPPPALVVAAGLAAALVAFAFTRPVEREVTGEVPFNHRSEFAYSAAAPLAPAVYPDGEASAGEPVFRRLAHRLDVDYAYGFEADDDVSSATTAIRLAAEVRDDNGWTATVAIDDRSTGGALTARGSIDLDVLGQQIAHVEQLTGIDHASYELSIVATTDVAATVAGQPVTERLTPRLAFRVDDLKLTPITADGSPDATSSMVTVSGGAIATTTYGVTELSVLGTRLTVPGLRILALLAVAGVALATAALVVRRPVRRDAAGVPDRYQRLVLPVEGLSLDATTVVDVTIETLARVAKEHDAWILHDEGSDTYLVTQDGVSFRTQGSDPRHRLVSLDRSEALVS